MFDIEKASLNKNTFIGLYFKCNENSFFYPRGTGEKTIEKFKSVLKTEALELRINDSHLIGLYTAMNSNGCAVPKFTSENEVKNLKGLNIVKIASEFSAVSNNILVNDKGCIVNPRIPNEYIKKITDCFGVEVVKMKIGGFNLVGAFNTATNKGILACNNSTDEELKKIESILKVKAVRGTTNMGMLANSFGVVANSKGCLVGETTSGFEINRIFEAIGD
jgi:translation initiation factor 6